MFRAVFFVFWYVFDMGEDFGIPFGKLNEWLLARRKIPANYAQLLTSVDGKVADALAEPMSDPAVSALLKKHKEEMTFFAVRDIYEAVAKCPDGQAKNFLGAHTHPGAAKWK